MNTFTVSICFTRQELELGHETLQRIVDNGAGARDPAVRRVLVAIEELAIAGRAFSANHSRASLPIQKEQLPRHSRRRLRLAK